MRWERRFFYILCFSLWSTTLYIDGLWVVRALALARGEMDPLLFFWVMGVEVVQGFFGLVLTGASFVAFWVAVRNPAYNGWLSFFRTERRMG